MQPRELLCVGLIAAMATAAVPACSQGPETYATPHLYALPGATTTRLFGMGGIAACVQDTGFPNPAFAGNLDVSHAGLRYSVTDFDMGLKLKCAEAWGNTPLAGGGQGIQLIGFNLDSNRGVVNTPSGPVAITMSEDDLAVHYGRRLSDQWLLGLGFSPVLNTTTNLYSPLDGSPVGRLDSEVGFGLRFGALYEYEPDSFVGLIFDRYTEDVTMTSVALPAPIAAEFTSRSFFLGVSGRLDERTLGAIEWGELRSKSGTMKTSTSGLRSGIEYAATDELDARAGINDGSPSLGLGYHAQGWTANYAYLSDWNEDAVAAALGGSDTHQLEATFTW